VSNTSGDANFCETTLTVPLKDTLVLAERGKLLSAIGDWFSPTFNVGIVMKPNLLLIVADIALLLEVPAIVPELLLIAIPDAEAVEVPAIVPELLLIAIPDAEAVEVPAIVPDDDDIVGAGAIAKWTAIVLSVLVPFVVPEAVPLAPDVDCAM
jgi:hypothetical protein